MDKAGKKTHTSIDLNNELQKALEHHQAGRLQPAEAIYRKILVINPNHSDALNLLGIIAHQTGRYEIAIDLMSKAIRNNPQVPFYYNNIGGVFTSQGRPEEAVVHYRKAIQLKPDYAEAYYNLGVVLKDQGRPEEAVTHYQKAIQLQPDYTEAYYNIAVAFQYLGKIEEAIASYQRVLYLQPDSAMAWNNLGNILKDQGRPEEAVVHYQKAILLKPDYARVYYNLGVVLKDQGRPEEAAASYQKAIQLQPDYAEAYNNYGVILHHDFGKTDDAIASYQKAIQLKPDYAEAYNNLGFAFKEKLKTDETIASYQKAIQLKPDYAEAYNNLGIVFNDLGKKDDAIASYQKAIHLKPDYAEAYNNLGGAFKDLGRIEDAVLLLKKALLVKPEQTEVHSNYLLTLHYDTGSSKETLLNEAIEWSRKHCLHFDPAKRFINTVDPDRKIKIGYVSGDFRIHPVGFFIEPVLINHNRENFEVYCYGNHHENDDMTRSFQSLPLHWRNIASLSDEKAGEMIVDDGIDILIDLSGHTAKNRLLLFAKKPAPLQATWIGYSDTTGMKAIDYIIADRYVIPEEDEKFYVEKAMRLPESYLCYSPPAYAPDVNSLPFLLNGYITFGCFNNIAKVNPAVIAVWSDILRAVPGSRLCMKTPTLGLSTIRNAYLKLFINNGIEPESVDFIGKSLTHGELLEQYGNIDIALDTFPYAGTTTTMEALWMGVPVAALVHDSFVGRVGYSLLSTSGLGELITFTSEDYVEKALALAGDIGRLTALRRSLRDKINSSHLCNGVKFTADLENIYRVMWRNWCENR
jgi:protein O-GlcNAc transferase